MLIMGKLHQLLAVKKDLAERANAIFGETKAVLGKKHFFYGSLRAYEPFEAKGDLTAEATEHEKLSYTVGEKLSWFADEFSRLIDCEYQIDETNMNATGTVSVDGLEMKDLPATFLLDMIGLLERIKKVYGQAQVLEPKHEWTLTPSAGEGVYKADPDEVSYRTKKVLQHRVLQPATKEHPAQIDKWSEDERIGKYVKKIWSGALTAHQKAMLLGRLDSLIVATRRALAEANELEHSNKKLATSVFKWLHRGIPLGGVPRDGAQLEPESNE
jgi:hypothetical protein